MDWDENTEMDMLKRIVALLFSLANLAQRACGAPRPVRGFVLWLLGRAYVAAWQLVHDSDFPPHAIHRGSEPDDAMRLAACYRALAIELRKQVRAFSRWLVSGRDEPSGDRSPASWPPRNACRILQALRDLALPATPRLDSS